MGTNTVLVHVIDQRGNRIPTVIPLYRLIDANETLDGDLWITYHGDKQIRKCRINMSAAEFDDRCNGLKTAYVNAKAPCSDVEKPPSEGVSSGKKLEKPQFNPFIDDFDDDIPF